MQPLLVVADEAVACFADEAIAARIYARAAEHREALGSANADVAHADAVVRATADVLSLSLADAYRLIGQHAMGSFTEQLESALRVHNTAHTCCLNLNELAREELQPLVPSVTVPVIDVEMINADTLRISVIATDEMLGLMCGLLMGLASFYDEVARFSKPTQSHGTEVVRAAGRRYVDVRFRADARTEPMHAKPRVKERRLSADAVALQSLFR